MISVLTEIFLTVTCCDDTNLHQRLCNLGCARHNKKTTVVNSSNNENQEKRKKTDVSIDN